MQGDGDDDRDPRVPVDRHYTPNERGVLAVLGGLLLVLAAVVELHPARLVTHKVTVALPKAAEASAAKTEPAASTPSTPTTTTDTTTTDTSRGTITLLVTGAGLFLLLLAGNGSRFSKLAVGGVSAEMPAPEQRNANRYVASGQQPVRVASRNIPLRSPLPADTAPLWPRPAGKVVIGGEPLSVFRLRDVPDLVLADAMAELTQQGRPADLRHFAFAARRSGPAPAPWVICFGDGPALRIGYT